MWYSTLLEKNRLPDWLLRIGIRKLLQQRLHDERQPTNELQQQRLMDLIAELKQSPIAIDTQAANQQHYEVPTAFYQYCLGKHLKYSSCYWQSDTKNLDDAEALMLQLTCDRAQLHNGQEVLELGCGWGSLSLFMSARYPQSNFTVVSKSRTQKQYIDAEAQRRGISNLTVITCDINSFDTNKRFHRVVSVEMFEHMRNYQLLMQRIAGWLLPDGKLFVHIFTHHTYAYKFEVKDETDWMSQYFFTGGIMPSDNLLLYFNQHLCIEQHWQVNGNHYAKTAEAWLNNMDQHRQQIMPLFRETYGEADAVKWWVYWRIFYLACAELWKYNKGEEWLVSHYLFQKK